jgi:outer membrane murein-binding lipoprotein Lpp
MENSKGNSAVVVIIAVVLTALIVGGGSYYMFNNQVQDLEQQVQDLQASEQETPKSEETVANEVATDEACYKTYTEDKVSFAYPCDWETDITNKNTMSAVGTVVAPDGKASFHYPAPDFGLQGMELTDEGSVTINGNDYSTKTYEGNGQTLVFVEMGTALSEYEYNLMLAYDNSEYKDELDHILETFEF